MSFKQVRIISAEVHDGLGGVHHAGETPTLPSDVADILIKLGRCSEMGDVNRADLEKAGREADQARVIELQKQRADAVMKHHDQLSADDRLASHDPEVFDPILDADEPNAPIVKRGPGRPRKNP